jgi:predicted nucleotidyltransferase
MYLDKDFEDFIRLLNQNEVAYLLVGGYAVGFNGYPRNTGDMDIWVKISEENATKLEEVIRDFGFASLGLTKEDFLNENEFLQMGYPPFRIDILTNISGVNFEESFLKRKLTYTDNQVEVSVIHINDLITNKIASGRTKDLADVEQLKKIVRKQSK